MKLMLVADYFGRQSGKGSVFPGHGIHFCSILIQIKVSMETVSPALGEIMEHFFRYNSLVFVAVEVGTVALSAR